MNVQESVARLEALLTRVQHNGALLRQERGAPEIATATLSTPTHASVHGTPTKLLPTSRDVAEPPPVVERSTLPPQPSSLPEAATLVPASNEPLETDYTGPGMAASAEEFEREESLEQTKPLWIGLSEPAPYGNAQGAPATLPPITLSPGTFLPTADSSDPSLPPLPGDAQEPAPRGFVSAETPELSDSSPPPSGERASARSPSLEAPMSLEEPLTSTIGGRTPPSPPAYDFEPEAAVELSTAPLDSSRTIAEARESRSTDAPPSALGATISLPDDDVGPVELELAEPPPSSLRTIAPTSGQADDELEADLPRTSFRAGYDDSLSAPPAARDELIAHDLSARERASSRPGPAARSTEVPISQLTRPASQESDLPPVLSSRPYPPVTVPPQSTIEPLRAPTARDDDSPFDAYEVTAQTTFEAPFPEETRTSVPPYQTTVSDVVVSARPSPAAVEFTPQPHAVGATFEGAFPRTKDASFLELLDTSLGLGIRG